MNDSVNDSWSLADERSLSALLLRETKTHGIVFVDLTGTIRGWNYGAEYLTGFATADVVGRPLHILYPPEDRDQYTPEQECQVALDVGFATDDRWQLRSDGGRIYTSSECQPLRDSEGRVTGFVKVFTNSTHILGRLKYLQNAVRQCTVQRQRKNQFIGSVAHELRGPLSPLRISIDVLRLKTTTGTPDEERLLVMDRQLKLLERMIEDLIDFVRVKEGKLSVRISEVKLHRIVERALESCRESAKSKGVRLRQHLPVKPLFVRVDSDRMIQVLVNLVGNAIKFTPSGGNVWIVAQANSDEFSISVRDSGHGISGELLPHVFDIFTQADASDTPRGAGMGVGLSVVKEIVSLHGGTVEVRSEGLGKGSEFVVRIPLTPEEHSTCESSIGDPEDIACPGLVAISRKSPSSSLPGHQASRKGEE